MEKELIYSIPEDIKLEIWEEYLILLKGSIYTFADGTQYTASDDIYTNWVAASGISSGHFYYTISRQGVLGYARYPAISSATEPTHQTGTLWYDTANNIIKKYTGTNWIETSLPLCMVTVSSSVISNIDQVFNGFNIIGSSMFVLPNVKGYVPAGRDLNGDLLFNTGITNSLLIRNNYNGEYAFLNYNNGIFNNIVLSDNAIYSDTANIFLNNVNRSLFYYNFNPYYSINTIENIKTLNPISQYANSPKYISLYNGLTYLFNNAKTLEDWFNVVYNLNTATGFGLDMWGKILNQGRQFSYEENGSTVNIYLGGEQTIDGIIYDAEFMEERYRDVLFLRALSNVTNCTIASMNNLLQFYYKDRGGVYVLEYNPMEIRYVFRFYVSKLEKAIFTTSIIPSPTGVGTSFEFIENGSYFGFFVNVGSGEEQPYTPFDNKPFYR